MLEPIAHLASTHGPLDRSRSSHIARPGIVLLLATFAALAGTACGNSVDDSPGGSGGGGANAPVCTAHADGPLAVQWSKTFRGSSLPCTGEECGGISATWAIDDMAPMPGGGLVVTGRYWGTGNAFSGQALPDADLQDAFLARLDDQGALLWLKPLAGSGTQSLGGMAVTPSGDFWLGAYSEGSVDYGGGPVGDANGSNLFVHYDASGEYLGAIEGVGRMVVAPDGTLVVVGGFYGEAKLGDRVLTAGGPEGHTDAFIARLDATGAVLDLQTFGDATPDPLPSMADQYFFDVSLDPDGNAFVVGTLSGSTDIGSYHLSAGDLSTAMVVSFTPTFDVRFAKTIGDGTQEGTLFSPGPSVLDAAGNLLLSGQLYGTLDFGSGPIEGSKDEVMASVLTTISPTGDLVRGEAFRAQFSAGISSLTRSGCWVRAIGISSGEVSIGGSSLAADETQPNFMLMLAPDGTSAGQQRFGGEVETHIAEAADGAFFLGGWYQTDVSIGGFTAPDEAEPTGFLARFSSLSP